MSTAQEQVRQGRTSPAVAITGAAHGLGHALTAHLAGSELVRKVIAIDEHRGDVAGVIWRLADVRDPALAARLADVPRRRNAAHTRQEGRSGWRYGVG